MLFLTKVGKAQTNPIAQQVPMSQDFGNKWFLQAGIPAGFAVWKVAGAPSTSLLAAANSNPNGDETGVDSATVVKSTGKAYGYSALGTGGVNVNNGQLYIQTSSSANGTDQLVLAINTTGFANIRASYEIEMINPQVKKTGVVFQYRLGTSGSWTVIDSTYIHNSTDRSQNQIDYYVNLPLGANANNLSVVQLRWAISRDVNPSGAGSCGLAIDNIVVIGDPVVTPQYFRSASSGNWNSVSTWLSSPDGITWSAATAAPSAGDLSIVISNGTTVNTTGISNLIIDEVTIESGATLWNAWGTALAIADGSSAVDLQVNGTFQDSSNVSVVWVNTARWQLGAFGNYIKSYNTNSTNWQLKYYNGIANIPATSNWYCRKASGSTVEPSISTTNGGPPYPQATYGNLYIENNSGSWNSAMLCKFSGSNNCPLIKGNFYVGGTGSGTVSFWCSNNYTSPVKVNGNIIIANGSTLRNEGTGFEVLGNLETNGILTYGSSTSNLIFSGLDLQTISGTGTISAWKMEVNKPANEILISRNVNIYGSLKLVAGILNTDASSTIIIQDNATSTNYSDASFIRGPLKKIGNDAFVFPVGKGPLLRTIAMDVGTASVTDVFTAEYIYQNPQTVYGNLLDPSLDHISSCEYWTLVQSVGSSSKKVTLSWGSNSCGVTNSADLRVARYNNTLWYNEGASAISGTLSSGIVTSNTTTGFWPFTLASTTSMNPLPIELISFSAEPKDEDVITEWVTASEINNDYFTVERSINGVNFVPLDNINGAGNSTHVLNYKFIDENPLAGISYYRLKQTDYDGKFTYSHKVAVKIRKSGIRILSVRPDKSQSLVEVKLSIPSNSEVKLFFQDLNGKVTYTTSVKGGDQYVFLPITISMSSGIYFIRLSDGTETVSDKFYY